MSQRQAYNVADNVNSFLGSCDLDLRCRAANAAYEGWFGKPREEILGIPMNKLLGPLYELNPPYIQEALAEEPRTSNVS